MQTKGAAPAPFALNQEGRPGFMRYRFVWAAMILAALGCHSQAREIPDAFSWSTHLEPGQTVHIRDGEGNNTVAASPSSDLRVRGSKQWRRGREKDIRFQVQSRGSDVFVCATWRNGRSRNGIHR